MAETNATKDAIVRSGIAFFCARALASTLRKQQ